MTRYKREGYSGEVCTYQLAPGQWDEQERQTLLTKALAAHAAYAWIQSKPPTVSRASYVSERRQEWRLLSYAYRRCLSIGDRHRPDLP